MEGEYSRVTVSNNSVQTNLVQVGRLQLQHFVNTIPVDLVRSVPDFLRAVVHAAEASTNQLLAVLVQQVEGGQVSTARDLDQLSESIADLSFRKSTKESKVKEGVLRCVVGTQAVLVVAVVHGNLDRYRGVDKTNDGRRDTNVVRVASVSSTSKSARS